MNKRIITVVACLMFVASAFAQTVDMLPYGYRHTIELSMGHSRNLVSYNGIPDKGLSVCASDRGFDFQLRYSLFFSQHWGAFASITTATYPVSADKTERALGRDEKFTYINEERYTSFCFENEFDDSGGSHEGSYILGAVYRHDIKRWSFRGRLGVGVGEIRPECATYLRFDKKKSEDDPIDLENVKILCIDGGDDVKTNWDCDRSLCNTFVFSPSLQVTFTPRHHMFFSAEVGFIGNIGKQQMRMHTYNISTQLKDYVKEENLSIITADDFFNYCSYRRTKLTDRESHRLNPGQFVTFNLGIGWNIGWNRNKKR